MVLDEGKCVVCEGMFLTKSLDEIGRCKHCAEHNCEPGAAAEQEQIRGDKQRRQDLKDLIRELMLELKEEDRIQKEESKLRKRPCKKCGNEFQPRAAANTICVDCQNAERVDRQSK